MGGYVYLEVYSMYFCVVGHGLTLGGARTSKVHPTHVIEDLEYVLDFASHSRALLEWVQRVQLRPSIFRKAHLHPSILTRPKSEHFQDPPFMNFIKTTRKKVN